MKTPLIKYTGSKRHIANDIISHFPKNIETYYEPFLGGGSVFFSLLKSDIKVNYYKLSDKNKSLIDIFDIVQHTPSFLIESYEYHWNMLQNDSSYFYTIRTEYNKTRCPHLFYFLTRTCYNGTIRYNSKGDFNTSHHFTRSGMSPNAVADVINYYHNLMLYKDIQFKCMSYETLNANDNDVVYLDPPYTNTKALYFGNIILKDLLRFVENLPCSWYMNLNGVNKNDNEEIVDIKFDCKKTINNGNSSFSRMKGKKVDVSEYFYYKIKPLEAL